MSPICCSCAPQSRKREFAIRSALGGSRARIVCQLLTESVLLSLASGILGTALGRCRNAITARRQSCRPTPNRRGRLCHRHRLARARLHPRSLLAYGHPLWTVPAFSASRSDLSSTLKESGNRSGTGFREGKARSLLVVSEISLALVLLIGAALLIRSFIALHEVGPGFDAHNVLTLEMSLNGQHYQKTAGLTQLLRDGRNRLNALPGVDVAAAGFWRPIDIEDGTGFQLVGRQADPLEKACCSSAWMSITPDYLRLFRIPLLRGAISRMMTAPTRRLSISSMRRLPGNSFRTKTRSAAHPARSHELFLVQNQD